MATKAVAATPPEDAPTEVEVAPAKGKKKLILISAAALALVLVIGGGATYYFIEKPAAETDVEASEAEAEPMAAPADDAGEPAKPRKERKRSAVSVFLPMETFTVNLADRDAERFAQVGVTLELDDAKTSDRLKLYMPVIRNDVLMVLTQKKAADLQDRDGKLQLAREIKRAAIKALLAADDSADGDDDAVRGVHFSSFIIQ